MSRQRQSGGCGRLRIAAAVALSMLCGAGDATVGSAPASATPSSFHAVATPEPGRTWAAGEGGLALIVDGEARWVEEAAGLWLLAVAFADADHGWAAGAFGAVLATEDGGETWTRQATGVGHNLHALAAPGPSEVWAGGSDGVILHSSDGGATWTLRRHGRDGVIRGISFSGDSAWAVGDHGMVLTSDDRGATWRRLPAKRVPTRANLYGLRFSGSDRGWVWGDFGTLLETRDGGRRWRRLDVGTTEPIRDLAWQPGGPPIPLDGRQRRGRALGFAERAATLLGADYVLDPLGEGPGAAVDPDPRLSAEGFDCVTLVEHALALELADGDGPLLPILDRIRYAGGRVDFLERHHFFVADWIPANSWLVEDVTSGVAGPAARRLERRMDRKQFLRSRGMDDTRAFDETRTTWIVPVAAVPGIAGRLETGTLVVFVGKKRWLFARHTGILVRDPDGTLRLRHASAAAGEVVDEDFLRYLEREGRAYAGIKLLRIVD